MTLTLNVGAPAISLTQISAMTTPRNALDPLVLPAASTAGTALIAVVGTQGDDSVVSAPTGWTRLTGAHQGTGATGTGVEIWAYLNNPGGITTVNVVAGYLGYPTNWRGFISEWANVYAVSAMEASGTATASAGTTLAPTTSSNVLTAGDLAISVWSQYNAIGAATFTTPATWTRLLDDGAVAISGHLDAEYLVNPATGATLGPTLTSSQTTISASGVIVVLKPAPPVADRSAYLQYNSVSLKLNTLDFALIDCPVPIQNSMTVTLSSPGEYPDWTGNVARVNATDLVELRTGHTLQRITATNAQAPNFTGAPFNLSDNPAANVDNIWLLENGDMFALENGTGDWLLESSVEEAGYTGLSIGTQYGQTTPYVTLVTLGTLRTFRVGLWPGMTFTLTSSNLALWLLAAAGTYTIQTVTVTYSGANPPTPVYDIQFGDRIQTLAEWTKAHAS